MANLNAWKVQLGFDASAVEKGLKSLDTKLASFNKEALSQQIKLENAAASRARQDVINVERTRQARAKAKNEELKGVSQVAIAEERLRKAKSAADAAEIRKAKVALSLEKQKQAAARAAEIRQARAALSLEKQKQAAMRAAERNAAFSRVQYITPSARMAQENRVFSGTQDAKDLTGRISNASGVEADKLRSSLAREVRSLADAQSRLNKITTRNSGEFVKLTRQIESSRRAIVTLRPQVIELSKAKSAADAAEIRQAKVALSLEKQKQAAMRAAERKAAFSRVQYITPSARLAQENRVFAGTRAAQNLAGRISNASGAEADKIRSSLAREVRSLADAQLRLNKITTRNSGEFVKLTRQIESSRRAIVTLRPQVLDLSKGFNSVKFASDSVTRSLKNLANSYLSIFAAVSGITSLIQIGRDLEDTQATLLLASGSSKQAAEDTRFVAELSDRVRIRVADLTRAYAKYAVAGRTAGFANRDIETTFTNLSEAIRASGLTQERANLAFLGFQQILSGSVVQAQEINQIIEQMPQFAGLASKAIKELGYSTDNYRKAIATGTVDSQKFIKVVSRLLGEQARSTGALDDSLDSVTGAYGGFRNELDKVIDTFFRAGASEALIDILEGMTDVMKGLTPAAEVLGKAFNNVIFIMKGLFYPIERLAEALGTSGLTAVTYLLSTALSVGLVKSFLSLQRVIGASALLTAAKGYGSAFLAWALGANAAAAATTKLALAVRFLKVVTGVALVTGIASYLFDRFAGSNSDNSQSSTPAVTNNVTINATDRSDTELAVIVDDVVNRNLTSAIV